MYYSFLRAEDSRIDKIQGSGLDLTITKQLVDLMGGTIACVSAPGKGTEFTVVLELKTATATMETTLEHPVGDSSGDPIPMHILVAEDNDLNWEIARTILEEHGCTCARALDGKQCVDMLENEEEGGYDLILMDIQMPVMNGRQASEKIRKSENASVRNIPIVAMTADAFAEDVRACEEAGMDGHIAKPIDTRKLFQTLQQIYRKGHTGK